MLDVGFSEILLTSAIALIVLGPERLPKVARQVGNWVGRARVMARQLSEQLEREVNAEELLKTQNKLNSGGNTANAAPNIASTPNPSIAPPTVTSLTEAEPPATPPEPLYGLSASATTAAAMHASDPKIAEPQSATVETPLSHD
jgi:sec-independent protein translocase protein TatB